MQDNSTPKTTETSEEEKSTAEASVEATENKDPHSELDALKVELEEAKAKAAENWERCLRATAEQDNIRKRAEREVEAARRFALEKFAQDLLAVWDSLELGVKAAREAGADKAHMEGAELTLRMLTETMHKHGVAVIDPKGETFDPEKHEAMSAVPTADAAPNTVIDVMQKGYTLNDRVLRPAMVIVAKAPA